ncbi:hypothetical protein J6590_020621 [Homalodisca vitripennis]|nr:hypothetical protein J6590_020621 [Homalodisca vitripennis]
MKKPIRANSIAKTLVGGGGGGEVGSLRLSQLMSSQHNYTGDTFLPVTSVIRQVAVAERFNPTPLGHPSPPRAGVELEKGPNGCFLESPFGLETVPKLNLLAVKYHQT